MFASLNALCLLKLEYPSLRQCASLEGQLQRIFVAFVTGLALLFLPTSVAWAFRPQGLITFLWLLAVYEPSSRTVALICTLTFET